MLRIKRIVLPIAFTMFIFPPLLLCLIVFWGGGDLPLSRIAGAALLCIVLAGAYLSWWSINA